jgi:hypothetical protein
LVLFAGVLLLVALFTGDQVVGGEEELPEAGMPAIVAVVVVVVFVVVVELQQPPSGVVGDTELVEVVGEMQAAPLRLLADEEELDARCAWPFDCVSCCW